MALFRLSAKTRGRVSSTLSASKHFSYVSRTKSYAKKEDLEYLISGNMPSWAVDDPSTYWEAADKHERANGRLYKELELALPVELTREQSLEMLGRFLDDTLSDPKLPYSAAIHEPHGESNNPHVHLMISERVNDGIERPPEQWFRRWNGKNPEKGGARKTAALKPKKWLLETRENWAAIQNRALETAGHDARVDHRSNIERGIALEPQNKIGAPRDGTRDDGRAKTKEKTEEHDRIADRNGRAILKNPRIAIDAITSGQAVFNRRDLARYLATHTASAEQFNACMSRVLSNVEIVNLPALADGSERFTSREMLKREVSLMKAARFLANDDRFRVFSRHIAKAARSKTMSDEQMAAFRHIVQPKRLAVVQGFAGAGKSYMLEAAKEAWEAQGYRVMGAALAGKAAEGLEKDAGIKCNSLASWELQWKHGHNSLDSKSVFVIDEAGMVGTRQLDRILRQARKAGAKVVLVGDTEQLQAIEAGAPMRSIVEEFGACTLSTIRRLKVAEQRAAAELMGRGQVVAGLRKLADEGHVRGSWDTKSAQEALIQRWEDDRATHTGKSQLILAYRRAEVRELNEMARAVCRERGELGKDVEVRTERGDRKFASGDRIVFLKNDKALGVMNGSLGVVSKVGAGFMTVNLDGGDDAPPRSVTFSVGNYPHIDHGYATTIHKAQGVTVDRIYVLASKVFDRHATYVALSRQRWDTRLYYSKGAFGSEEQMMQHLGRVGLKDNALTAIEAQKANEKLWKSIQRSPKYDIADEPLPRMESVERSEGSALTQWRDAACPFRDLEPKDVLLSAWESKQFLREHEPTTIREELQKLDSVAEAQQKLAEAYGRYQEASAARQNHEIMHPLKSILDTEGRQRERAAFDEYREAQASFDREWKRADLRGEAAEKSEAHNRAVARHRAELAKAVPWLHIARGARTEQVAAMHVEQSAREARAFELSERRVALESGLAGTTGAERQSLLGEIREAQKMEREQFRELARERFRLAGIARQPLPERRDASALLEGRNATERLADARTKLERADGAFRVAAKEWADAKSSLSSEDIFRARAAGDGPGSQDYAAFSAALVARGDATRAVAAAAEEQKKEVAQGWKRASNPYRDWRPEQFVRETRKLEKSVGRASDRAEAAQLKTMKPYLAEALAVERGRHEPKRESAPIAPPAWERPENPYGKRTPREFIEAYKRIIALAKDPGKTSAQLERLRRQVEKLRPYYKEAHELREAELAKAGDELKVDKGKDKERGR